MPLAPRGRSLSQTRRGARARQVARASDAGRAARGSGRGTRRGRKAGRRAGTRLAADGRGVLSRSPRSVSGYRRRRFRWDTRTVAHCRGGNRTTRDNRRTGWDRCFHQGGVAGNSRDTVSTSTVPAYRGSRRTRRLRLCSHQDRSNRCHRGRCSGIPSVRRTTNPGTIARDLAQHRRAVYRCQRGRQRCVGARSGA
jgi:hypothetical protein